MSPIKNQTGLAIEDGLVLPGEVRIAVSNPKSVPQHLGTDVDVGIVKCYIECALARVEPHVAEPDVEGKNLTAAEREQLLKFSINHVRHVCHRSSRTRRGRKSTTSRSDHPPVRQLPRHVPFVYRK